jgi:DNA-binding CsgD family transcriptional regulator
LLTHRQLEILREVAKGQSNKSIARNLSLSVNTVEAHVSRIIRKLKVCNRTQAALALSGGIPPVARSNSQIPRNSRLRSKALHNPEYR